MREFVVEAVAAEGYLREEEREGEKATGTDGRTDGGREGREGREGGRRKAHFARLLTFCRSLSLSPLSPPLSLHSLSVSPSSLPLSLHPSPPLPLLLLSHAPSPFLSLSISLARSLSLSSSLKMALTFVSRGEAPSNPSRHPSQWTCDSAPSVRDSVCNHTVRVFTWS